MLDDIGGATSQLVRFALDATIARHRIIANNIANVNTPGYRAQGLSFETQLADAIEAAAGARDGNLATRLDSLKHDLNSEALVYRSTSEKVELDREIAKMSENTLRYQALLEGLGKRGKIVKMAISGQGV